MKQLTVLRGVAIGRRKVTLHPGQDPRGVWSLFWVELCRRRRGEGRGGRDRGRGWVMRGGRGAGRGSSSITGANQAVSCVKSLVNFTPSVIVYTSALFTRRKNISDLFEREKTTEQLYDVNKKGTENGKKETVDKGILRSGRKRRVEKAQEKKRTEKRRGRTETKGK